MHGCVPEMWECRRCAVKVLSVVFDDFCEVFYEGE